MLFYAIGYYLLIPRLRASSRAISFDFCLVALTITCFHKFRYLTRWVSLQKLMTPLKNSVQTSDRFPITTKESIKKSDLVRKSLPKVCFLDRTQILQRGRKGFAGSFTFCYKL
jgi:hypothetical protein